MCSSQFRNISIRYCVWRMGAGIFENWGQSCKSIRITSQIHKCPSHCKITIPPQSNKNNSSRSSTYTHIKHMGNEVNASNSMWTSKVITEIDFNLIKAISCRRGKSRISERNGQKEKREIENDCTQHQHHHQSTASHHCVTITRKIKLYI